MVLNACTGKFISMQGSCDVACDNCRRRAGSETSKINVGKKRNCLEEVGEGIGFGETLLWRVGFSKVLTFAFC